MAKFSNEKEKNNKYELKMNKLSVKLSIGLNHHGSSNISVPFSSDTAVVISTLDAFLIVNCLCWEFR